MVVKEGLCVDKNLALCERLVGVNNPSGKMSLYLMTPWVKRIYFQVYFLKIKKSLSDGIFRNEGPGFWVKKIMLAAALQWHNYLSVGVTNLLGPLFLH